MPDGAPRSFGWQPYAALRCGAGHPLNRRDSMIEGALVLRCECGRALFVLAAAASYARDPLEGLASPDVFVVYTLEITGPEARWIAKARPTVLEVLDVAGLLWRPPDRTASPILAPGDASR